MEDNLNKIDLMSKGNSLVLKWKKYGIRLLDVRESLTSPSEYKFHKSAVIAIEFEKYEFVNKNYQPHEKYYNDFGYIVTVYDPEAEHDFFNKEWLIKNPWKAKQIFRTKMLVVNESDNEIILRGGDKQILFDFVKVDSVTLRFKKNSDVLKPTECILHMNSKDIWFESGDAIYLFN